MALAPRWWVFLLLLVSAPALAAGSPEVQLCLQHLKPAEKARATNVLGPLEELPRYRVQVEVERARREG
jgi:hypothetical protein